MDVGGDHITLTVPKAAWNAQIRNEDTRAWKDYGAAHFGDFEFDFILEYTDVEAGDVTNNAVGLPVALSNSNGGFNAIWGSSAVMIYGSQDGANDDVLEYYIVARSGGGTDGIDGSVALAIAKYYVTFARNGAVLTADFYSDAERTALVFGLSCACTEDTLRYCAVAVSRDAVVDPNDHTSGYIEDLDMKGSGVNEGSVDLAAEFEVPGIIDASVELLGEFIVRHIGTPVELLGEFVVRQETSAELFGEFIVRHIGTPLNLFGEFVVKQETSVELLGVFDVRQETSVNLLGFFEGQTSVDLAAEFEVSGIIDASVELLGEFIVRHIGTPVELLGEFIVRHIGTPVELLGEFVVRHESSVELLAEFVVTQPASVDLLGEFIVQHAAAADLGAAFDGQTSVDLSCVFNVSQARGTADLPASIWVNYYILNLPAKFYVRQTSLRATDFTIIDNTRGLTIHDADREMTVTPRRRMRVK